MEAIHYLSCREFGITHFQRCDLGDARLTRRAVDSAATILKHPGGTLPDKLPASDLIGFYRLANNPKVTHQKMLSGHRRWVLEQMQALVGEVAAPRVLLLISDTTEADFTGLESAAAELGSIGNGGSDSFENIEFFETQGEKYCIRSKSNRNIPDSAAGDDDAICRLHDFARALPRVDQRSISVSENHGQPARCATVAIGFSSVTLPAPQNRRGEHSSQSIQSWVVHVREISDPAEPRSSKGPEPLEWILLTSVPVHNAADAWERVDWYNCRPVIDEIYVELLSTMRFKKKQPLTIFEFFHALAYLGGHLNRRTDKPPGWLVLWRGWTKLQSMVSAVEADRRSRCV